MFFDDCFRFFHHFDERLDFLDKRKVVFFFERDEGRVGDGAYWEVDIGFFGKVLFGEDARECGELEEVVEVDRGFFNLYSIIHEKNCVYS